MFSGTIGYYGYYGLRYYKRVLYTTRGYYGTIGYYGYHGTTDGYYVVPAGTMVVPEVGTIRVL